MIDQSKKRSRYIIFAHSTEMSGVHVESVEGGILHFPDLHVFSTLAESEEEAIQNVISLCEEYDENLPLLRVEKTEFQARLVSRGRTELLAFSTVDIQHPEEPPSFMIEPVDDEVAEDECKREE